MVSSFESYYDDLYVQYTLSGFWFRNRGGNCDDLGRLMFSLPPFEVLGKLRASALLVKDLNCESHLKILLVLGFADAHFRFCSFCCRE